MDQASLLRSALQGSYLIERELGQGGMATVYLARDLKHDRLVAMKVLRPELALTLGGDRFLQEIRVTARLDHPHILPLFDSGSTDALIYYTMPFVTGESLRARLQRDTKLPVDEALEIVATVARALDHAHKQGVVHRDLKPENILLRDGGPVVADFGIALAVAQAGRERLTATGLSIGTPQYMSPEQATADPDLDARSDIYSLGCVLYELLAGRPPFTGTSLPGVLVMHAVEPVPSLASTGTSVPPHIEAAMLRALAKKPSDRFATAAEFARDLSGGTGASLRAPARRRLGARIWLAATALTLAVLAVGASAFKRRAEIAHARNDLVPQVAKLINERDYSGAFALANETKAFIPDDPRLNRLWEDMSRFVSITSTPAGAEVRIRDYAKPDAPWQLVGQTPMPVVQLPIGFFRWRIEKPGFRTVESASSGVGLAVATLDSGIRLFPENEMPPGMVYVSGGMVALDVPGLTNVPPVALKPFLLDRTEVTNRAFKLFVDSGGYARRELWREPFVRDRRTVEWAEAVRSFRDSTGRPGPAGWQGSSYPTGAGDLPVSGISWYEAAAYAEFVHKELLTLYHWDRAAGASHAAEILPLSNFARRGYAAVGTTGGVGPFGTYDMAGNVREWLRNADGAARYAVGGAWDDEPYMFNESESRSPWDRSSTNGVRLMRRLSSDETPAAALASFDRRSQARAAVQVSEGQYRTYASMHGSDRVPLSALVESVDSTPEQWIIEHVSYAARYKNERVPALFFRPKNGVPPFQVVVYFPGSNALSATSTSNMNADAFDYLITDGRAVLYPIYQGTFGRGAPRSDDDPDMSTRYRDELIMWSKDFRQSLDYLDTRGDVDHSSIGYLGVSFGAAVAPSLLALDSRVKAAVLQRGGYWNKPTRPEVDQETFAPHVTVPTIMINGRQDPFFPFESSQRPLFRALGTTAKDKRLVVFEAGHAPPKPETVKETLDWFDRYLGPVTRGGTP